MGEREVVRQARLSRFLSWLSDHGIRRCRRHRCVADAIAGAALALRRKRSSALRNIAAQVQQRDIAAGAVGRTPEVATSARRPRRGSVAIESDSAGRGRPPRHTLKVRPTRWHLEQTAGCNAVLGEMRTLYPRGAWPSSSVRAVERATAFGRSRQGSLAARDASRSFPGWSTPTPRRSPAKRAPRCPSSLTSGSVVRTVPDDLTCARGRSPANTPEG